MILSITPHDLNLSAVAILIVFVSLLLLYVLYSLFGRICVRQEMRRKRTERGHEAAENSRCEIRAEKEKAAAIALALYLDAERKDCGKITFSPRKSPWADKTLTFRKTPQR